MAPEASRRTPFGRATVAVVNEERLGSTLEFAAALAPHLAVFADGARPLPSDMDLARLIEVMFYASLQEEEERRSEFNVAWSPGAHDCAAALVMSPPVRATPKSLAKL